MTGGGVAVVIVVNIEGGRAILDKKTCNTRQEDVQYSTGRRVVIDRRECNTRLAYMFQKRR